MKTKLFIVLFITAISFVSCNKEESIGFVRQDRVEVLDEKEAERNFAIILSKALSEDTALRAFIKDEALRQFDCDYDVFYPFVADVKYNGTKSFRNALLNYCDENELSAIESALPKLTIMVPDYSWIGNQYFSVYKWDTGSDFITVGDDDKESLHPVFAAGEEIGKLPVNAVPEFPVLIIKSNERIIVSPETKSGQRKYSFADPAFDRNIVCATRGNYWLWGDVTKQYDNQNTAVDLVSKTGNTISCEDLNTISPETVEAYKEFGLGWNGGVHRDYIYYGMSKENTNNGINDSFKREMLFRFHILLNNLKAISDDKGKDPSWNTIIKNEPPIGHECTFNDAINALWAGGKYEICIDFVYQNLETREVDTNNHHVLTVNPEDIMYIRQCTRRFQWTIKGETTATYTIVESNVEPKWYYPWEHGQEIYINNNSWDLAKVSDNIVVKMYELDRDGELTEEEDITFKQSHSINVATNYEKDGSIEEVAIKRGFNVIGIYGNETTEVKKVNYKVKTGSDDFGNASIEYIDNVVDDYKDGCYDLNCYGDSGLRFSLIPIDKRNLSRIRHYFTNREPVQDN